MSKTKITVLSAAAVTVAAVLGFGATSVFGGVASTGSTTSAPFTLTGAGIKAASYGIGSRFTAYVQRDSAGNVCLLSGVAGDSRRSGGCNPAAAPLAGKPMLAIYNFDGGPDVASVRDARVAGLVDSSVSRVAMMMSDGTQRTIALVDSHAAAILGADYRAFAVSIPDAWAIERGVSLSQIIAYDAGGKVVQRDVFDGMLKQ